MIGGLYEEMRFEDYYTGGSMTNTPLYISVSIPASLLAKTPAPPETTRPKPLIKPHDKKAKINWQLPNSAVLHPNMIPDPPTRIFTSQARPDVEAEGPS